MNILKTIIELLSKTKIVLDKNTASVDYKSDTRTINFSCKSESKQ